VFVPARIDHVEVAVGARFYLQHGVRGHLRPLHELAPDMHTHFADHTGRPVTVRSAM
jgi:hypothetical protein